MTECAGRGNRKNLYFRAWLDAHQVRAYPGRLRLIGELRQAWTPIAVFSVSRSSEAVLRNAGMPDVYQRSELWRFDLVDPDNRHPVALVCKPRSGLGMPRR
ncbi:MAG: hypothetical protein JJU06_10825 [Ectothiorhodospiraceae bacterium]|nr:hypothetical protein [Ectothiorhodospiraceae bacterium]MCH8505052.1 hypothetical protein [Ectothiorhodospiraceae bacterium]